MPYRVTDFESTPNPNAIKCNVTPSPADTPRSYFNADAATEADDALAISLFAIDGVTSLLIHTSFITVNKQPDAKWGPIRKAVSKAVKDAP